MHRRLRPASNLAVALIPLLAVALACLVPGTASAQVISPACQRTCPNPVQDPAGAASCTAAVTTCQTKLGMYVSYMGQLGLGGTQHRLSSLYLDVLRPHFPGVNIDAWRFVFADRQPAGNATTDCSVTYFNNSAYVDRLRSEALSTDSDIGWLAHELWHYVQCGRIGGRDFYATMWFADLNTAFIQNADLATLHGNMPMEQDAFTNSAAILRALRTSRDRNGRLVRPITARISSLGSPVGDQINATVGTQIPFRAAITGGSTPYNISWSLKRPSDAAPVVVLQGNIDYAFTPAVGGVHEVHLRVSQEGSNLTPFMRMVRVSVPLVVQAPIATNPTSPVRSATVPRAATSTVTVRVVDATGTRGVAGATVALGTATVPDQLGTRTTDVNGNVTFTNVTIGSYQIRATRRLCTTATIQQTVSAPATSTRMTLRCRS
jgi:hypothetical protein